MNASLLKTIFFCFFFLTGCGFKIIDNTQFDNYYLNNIETAGNSKINFFLKSELSNSFNNSEKGEQISIIIQSKKDKKIRERNISNQITKYEIILTANVEFKIIDRNITENFVVTNSGSYDLNNNQAKTISNQDDLEKFLAEKLSKQILQEIRFIIDDI